jgi:hypothetical protein
MKYKVVVRNAAQTTYLKYVPPLKLKIFVSFESLNRHVFLLAAQFYIKVTELDTGGAEK